MGGGGVTQIYLTSKGKGDWRVQNNVERESHKNKVGIFQGSRPQIYLNFFFF